MRKIMRRFLYAYIIAILFTGCCTIQRPNVSGSSWDNAALVAEQRLEIERLRNDFYNMGRLVGSSADGIDRAAERLSGSLNRISSIEDVLDAMDEYVRSIERENRQLRELQRANWPKDAGER